MFITKVQKINYYLGDLDKKESDKTLYFYLGLLTKNNGENAEMKAKSRDIFDNFYTLDS